MGHKRTDRFISNNAYRLFILIASPSSPLWIVMVTLNDGGGCLTLEVVVVGVEDSSGGASAAIELAEGDGVVEWARARDCER